MINTATNIIGATRKAGGAPAPFNPSQLDGLVGWFRADQGITLNGSDVSEWAPIAGTSSPLSQPNSAKQPAFLASGINGLPSVNHDANLQGLAMDAPAKLMDYANTDNFFVLMVETMELASSANTGSRDSFDIIGWNNGTTATAFHNRSKTAVSHNMGLIGVFAGSPFRSYTALFSPTLAAGDPHWWAYGARRGRRFDRVKSIVGGSAGTAAELSIAYDDTLVSTGGFTETSNVITIPTTGKYTIGAAASFINVVATGNASLGLKVNGGAYTAYSTNGAIVSSFVGRGFTVTLSLNAGDTIEVFTVFTGTITTRDYSSSAAINLRIQGYEYYTMDAGITPASISNNTFSNTLPTSNTVTDTYTLRASTADGTTTGGTFGFTPIGFISEIIICNEVPDAATFTQLNNYLFNRYGLGSNI